MAMYPIPVVLEVSMFESKCHAEKLVCSGWSLIVIQPRQVASDTVAMSVLPTLKYRYLTPMILKISLLQE